MVSRSRFVPATRFETPSATPTSRQPNPGDRRQQSLYSSRPPLSRCCRGCLCCARLAKEYERAKLAGRHDIIDTVFVQILRDDLRTGARCVVYELRDELGAARS